MTQLTQDDFVAELEARGHGRFATASLNRYLDWALQDVYRLAKYDTVKDATATGVLAVNGASVTFTTIGGAAAKVHSINGVFIKDASGGLFPLVEATRDVFWEQIYPNTLRTTSMQQVGQPSQYFVYAEIVYLWPICDGAYTWYVQYTERGDSFANGAATSGLPERMDSAILAAAEVQCCKRNRDLTALALAQSTLMELVEGELTHESRQFTEEGAQVGRYEH